ncbi:MAG: Gfo/Idh/MocA family oxidoreductase [Terricaulis sp.]
MLEAFGLVMPFAEWPEPATMAMRIVTAVLLFESFVWLSYYCLWRNFMEPNYTLYHPAEYLVLFPVIVAVQVLSIARLLSAEVGQVTGWMLGGQANETYPLGLIGWFYVAILLSNLRGMIPRPSFKRNSNTMVIGAGDVAMKRLLPAMRRIMKAGPFKANVVVHSLSDLRLRTMEHPFELILRESTEAILADARVGAGAAIITTPSDKHMVYVRPLVESGLRVVCEKPLSSVRAEIDELQARRGAYRDNVFALSYYVLEKALPLTFFLEGNRAFLKYLCISRTDTAGMREITGDAAVDEVQRFRAALGEPRSISIRVVEGLENSPTSGSRAWTEAPGGLMFETAIHPLLLMVKAQRALAPGQWNSIGEFLQVFKPQRLCGRSLEAARADATTFLRMRQAAAQGTPEIDITVAKYAPQAERSRRGEIRCARGSLRFDFDEKTLNAQLAGQAWALSLSIRPEFSENYDVQTDLALRFIRDGWNSSRFDDFDDQIDVLSWMSLRAAQYESGVTFTYSSRGRQADFIDATS